MALLQGAGRLGCLEQPGDLGQVVDLFGRDVGLAQLHGHLAVFPMAASTPPGCGI